MTQLDLARPATRLGAGRGRAEAKRSLATARDLEEALKRSVGGEVRFDQGSRALYASDLSIYRHIPIGVVVPRDAADVVAAVAACRERDVPILGRGCGTSLAGQTCNVAVVIDFSKYMNRLITLDPDSKVAEVEPGLINDELRQAALRHGLTFAPDPATHPYCTLGGNIGNNSCGAHTVMGGKTVDNVIALDVLTYDGHRMSVGATSDDDFARIVGEGGRKAEIYQALRRLRDRYSEEVRRRYPNIPRRVSGYNLDELLPERGFHVARALVGSESTCALTLSAVVRLIDFPAARSLVVLAYDDVARAADEVAEIRGLGPLAIEGFTRHVIDNLRRQGKPVGGAALLPEADAYLLIEFGGEDQKAANAAGEKGYQRLKRIGTHSLGMRLFEKPADQSAIWHIRESGVGASHIPNEEESWPSWEDAAVPPERLGDYLRDFDKLNKRYGYAYTLFGHFGDGCIHTRMTFGLKTADGVAKFRRYMEDASDLCLSYGGSLSGEHGDGQAKGELLPKMFGAELTQAFREFKSIWDPAWRMNPGKIVDARPLDADLRLGPEYRPKSVATHFSFADDDHVFALAAERCFGVGKCRTPGGQTMCPSFQATREERHSTRGRAHLLFEMIRGDFIKDGWKSEAVREALDLCLQCKGCKHDCPVSVDMATYKAEFLAHYYEGRIRPRSAYSMGLIFLWSRLAMLAPGLANAALGAPVIGPALKLAAGFTQARAAPTFAAESFEAWWKRRLAHRVEDPTRPKVVLWPDTFNNYFLPGTLKAAVRVLEDAGYRIEVPTAPLCCGRPLYDYGMLGKARSQLKQILGALRPAIRARTPVVGLEPSCVSVFRDEMMNLMPEDPDARDLSRLVKTLGEVLLETKDWRPPSLPRKAVTHMHCHQKSVLNAAAELEVLKRVGLEVETPAPGCCGHAGSFGYEAEHHAVSMQIGEQALLPGVRSAPADALVVADGFSCRMQIKDGAGRWAIHPAEAIALALDSSIDPATPDRRYQEPPARPGAATLGIAAGVGVVLAAAIAAPLALRRR
jgi:FAD/FMN-containing dehydrogenase/Fe-S oxidoreductase